MPLHGMASRHLLTIQLITPKDFCTLVLSHHRHHHIGHPLTGLYTPPIHLIQGIYNKFCNNFTCCTKDALNPLKPKDPYNGHTAPLTSKRCILCIYSRSTGTEYFKHGIYSLFFSLQNAVCFIILTYLVPVLFTFYIQSVLKFKKIISAPKG